MRQDTPQDRRIAVVGLGYVGLPVACAFARAGFDVTGFDTDRSRIAELREGRDRTREVARDDLCGPGLSFTDDAAELRRGDFFIVTVPTPIDEASRPDLSALLCASRLVGAALKRGDIVVYESTVYPGATEDDCLPVLEQASGLRGGEDFTIGYSPERINPGDRVHRFETVVKVVSGQDARTLDIVAETYGRVVAAGIHRAPSIKVAEASKVIENTQRDLNIALMNELSQIFARMDIDTQDVLAAAGTKWNFLRFQPGLVGGHCIGVDPYYLTHQAQRLGYRPEIVLAGRRVNDSMGRYVARECIRRLIGLSRADPVVTVLGVTFKENVPDIRNSKAFDIVGELRAFGVRLQVVDPEADPAEVERAHGIVLRDLADAEPADAVIVAVAHRVFREGGWPLFRPLLGEAGGFLLDVKGIVPRDQAPAGVEVWRL